METEMDVDERLTALKKASADIILNTKKEEAARIMMWEQKAQCFEKELHVVKEKGLLRLMRLKQIMDAKIIEAEMTSLSQQKKIEELEAQLEEAEDIVSDLRVELREVEAELERVGSEEKEGKQSQDLDTTNPGELTKVNAVVLPPESQGDSVTTSNTEVNSMNQKIEGYHSCHTKINTGNCYVASADLPSISLKDEVPELYQNGHTQRIHAAEGNPSDREIMHKETFSEHSSKMEIIFLRDESTLATGNAPIEDPSEMALGFFKGQGMKLGYAESSDDKLQSIDACGVPYARDEHEELKGKMDLSEQDIENICNQLLFIKNLCNQLLKSESRASDVDNRVPSQPLNNRVIKYTYQRKRKRELLSASDENASIPKSPSKNKNVLKLHSFLDTQDEFSDRIIS
ncbi:uncharacterized protein LOC132052431 isoform X1 [Lycium ferocissimum]|uniref:uncharacterized protein LOC132052431 isoform X1 n=2 Tax=Lycium ferocissimum TaxID=112874 RepID=UPI00281686E3|nr:uncharacterized protein LOC132052431 isoform X1 [Lycium ferocissimum]XP_059299943.1 uncharacterized protein LOC132052431 isoform X1 [Lycium ferocissimum]